MEKKQKPFKKTKRFLSLLLVFSLAFSVLPTSVFAAEVQNKAGQWSNNENNVKVATPDKQGDEKYPESGSGSVKMEKSAAWSDTKETDKTKAEVTFTVEGTPISTGVDVVVVLDKTDSMGPSNGSVGICSGTAKLEKKETIYSYSCSSKKHSSGLRFNEALSEEDLAKEKCSIVVGKESCGSAFTYSSKPKMEPCGVYVCEICGKETKKGIVNNNPPLTTTCNATLYRLDYAKIAATNFTNTMLKETGNRVALVTFDEDVRKSVAFTNSASTINSAIKATTNSGETNYEAALNEANKLIKGRGDKTRPTYVVFLTDGKPNKGGVEYKEYADKLKSVGDGDAKVDTDAAKIYSIAFCLNENTDEGATAIDILKNQIAGVTGVFKNALYPSDLNGVFDSIARSLKQAGKNAKIVDVIADEFELDGTDKNIKVQDAKGKSIKNQDGVKVSVSDKIVTVELPYIGEKVVVKIPIKLTTTALAAEEKANRDKKVEFEYDTNEGNAELTYTNFEEKPAKQVVESPALAKKTAVMIVQNYLVKADGTVDADSFDKKTTLGDPVVFEEVAGDSKLTPGNHTVTPEAEITIGGFRYRLNSNTKQENEFASGKETSVTVEEGNVYNVYFGYTKLLNVTYIPNLGAAIETGYELSPDNPVVEVEKGKTVVTLPTATRTDGWILDEGMPWTTDAENKTAFTGKTVILEDTMVYANWVKDSDKWLSYTINYYKDSVNGDPFRTFTSADKAKVLKDTEIDPEIVKNTPESYSDGKLATGSSTKITTDGQVINVVYTAEQWNYTVEHYKEGITTPFAVEKDLKIAKHTPSVTSVSDKASDAQGYKRDEAKLEGILPYTITKDNEVINVYYVVDTSNTTPYTVEYFTKDGDTETPLDADGRFVGGTVPTATLLLEEDDKTALKSAKEKPPVGYKVSETELPTTVEKDGKTVIKIVYEKDPAQWASYTVEYRKETGDKVYTAIDGSKKEVKDILLKKGEDTLAEFDVAAYHKDIEATHDTGSITTGDEGRKLTSGVNTFIVDYPAKSYPYTVNFLAEDLKIPSLTGTFKSYATPKTYSQEEANAKAPTGYEYASADKTLPFTFSATESVLNITYKKVIKYGTYKIEYSWEDGEFDTVTVPVGGNVEVGKKVTLTDDQKIAKMTGGYKVKSSTESIDIKEGDDNVLKVVYEKDPAQWASYTVEYYKGSIDKIENRFKLIPKKEVLLSKTPTVSVDMYAEPGDGYDKGKIVEPTDGVTGNTVTLIKGANVIKVLYLSTAPTELTYTVEYYKTEATPENRLTPIEGSFVGGKFTAESTMITEDEVTNLADSITNNTPTDGEYDFTTEIDRSTILTDKAVYKVVYTPKKEIVGDIIPVIHEYYLNGSTLEGTFNGETGAIDGATVNTEGLRRLNGYTYTSTLIESVLKEAVAPIKEIQERIATLDANIKKNQAIINEAEPEATKSYVSYLGLQEDLKLQIAALVEARKAELLPPVEEETPIPETLPAKPETESKPESDVEVSTPETKPETTPSTPESSPVTPSEPTAPIVPNAPAAPETPKESTANPIAPMSVRFVSDVKSPVVEESTPPATSEPTPPVASEPTPPTTSESIPPAKKENPPTLEIKPLPVAPTQSVEDIQTAIDLLKKDIAEIEKAIPELIAAHKAIVADTIVLEEANVELIALQEEMNVTSSIVPEELSETVTSTDPTFVYDAKYTYTITIRYDRTVAPVVPPVTPPDPPTNPENNPSPTTPDTTPVDDGPETTDIFDEPIPLAKLPDGPDDIIEILDEEIPLGVLPVSGGLQGKGLATAGLLALVAAALLKLKKKDED